MKCLVKLIYDPKGGSTESSAILISFFFAKMTPELNRELRGMQPILERYLELFLKPQCLGGDLSATREALEMHIDAHRALPDWLAQPVLRLAAEAAAKPKVIGKGPKATDRALIARNWIDLQRHLAIEHCTRKIEAAGKKAFKKIILEEARKILAEKSVTGGTRAIAESDSRVRKAIKRQGFLNLELYYDGDLADLNDNMFEENAQE